MKIWNSFILFQTALMIASKNNNIEIVKLLLEQKGIDINAKNVYLLCSKLVSAILFFKIIFGTYLIYFIQHL